MAGLEPVAAGQPVRVLDHEDARRDALGVLHRRRELWAAVAAPCARRLVGVLARDFPRLMGRHRAAVFELRRY